MQRHPIHTVVQYSQIFWLRKWGAQQEPHMCVRQNFSILFQFFATDEINDVTDTYPHTEPNVEPSSEQPKSSPTNSRNSTYNLRHNAKPNSNDDYR